MAMHGGSVVWQHAPRDVCLDVCLDVCEVHFTTVLLVLLVPARPGAVHITPATKLTSAHAWSPEEHWRFTQYSGTVSGMPAANWAMRAGPA